jgi:hypothetical protein
MCCTRCASALEHPPIAIGDFMSERIVGFNHLTLDLTDTHASDQELERERHNRIPAANHINISPKSAGANAHEYIAGVLPSLAITACKN